MPSKLYELRVFKGQQPVRTASRLLCTLDLTNPAAVDDLLRRHLLAAAERDRATRQDAHLYHLDVHEIRGDRAENRPSHTYALPVQA